MDELIKALETIKAECEKSVFCRDCRLGNEHNECMVNKITPEEWDIVNPSYILGRKQ